MGAAAPAFAQAPQPAVDVVQVDGVIDPPVARHVKERIAAAVGNGAHAVILQLDTPGGLQVSNEEMVAAVSDSPVPVIAWIAPRNARAASTGALMVYAAHRAYLSEGTELGPVLPATLDSSAASSDAAARAIVDRLSEESGASLVVDEVVPAERAIASGTVDGTASSLRDLLQALDGVEVETGSGTSVLETWDEVAGAPGVTIRFAEMGPFQRLLHAVTDPKTALFLFLAGLFGLIFELYNPGIGLAAIVGAGSLALSVYSLSVLPTSWGALLLVVAGISFLLLDLHATALGVPSVVGIGALIAGSAFLYSGAPGALQLSPWAIAGAVVVTLVFFISVMTAALRVRLRRPVSDEEGVVGTIGEATTDIAPEGTVLTKGTLWRARTMETGIAAGAKVEVKATEGLVLLVEPLHEHDGSGSD